MKIGIDIDGCINNQEDFTINYGMKYIVENNLSYRIVDINQGDSCKVFDWDEKTAHAFWEEYRQILARKDIRVHCSEVIRKLKDEGNEIFIITARYNGDGWWDSKSRDKVEKITKKYLKKQKIKYNRLIFSENKQQVIKDNNIDVMIEDNIKYITEISKIAPVIIMNTRENSSLAMPDTYRAYCWWDVYRIINGIKS